MTISKRLLVKTVLAAAFASTLAFSAQAKEGSIKVGVTAGPHAAIVNAAAGVAKTRGLNVEVVEFTDYLSPNRALAEGSLDADVYQHQPFLDNFNKQQGTKLVKISDAVVQPMGFYSNKIKDVKDIPNGASFTIPNDPSNAGRALLLLEAAGLIKLTPGLDSKATVADIVENPKKLKIVELEAAQLPRSLDDASVAVIPMNYVLSAGLKAKDGFYFESLKASYALIIIPSRDNNANDPKIKAFVEAYRSPEVKAFIEKTFNGAVLPTWE